MSIYRVSNGWLLVHFQEDLLFSYPDQRQCPGRWKFCKTKLFVGFEEGEYFPMQTSELTALTS